MGKLFYLELCGFLGTAVVGVLWLFYPQGNWSPLLALFGLTGIAADIARRYVRGTSKGRFASNGARIQHREALRKELQEEIFKCRAEKLRQDVIVRHVDRIDNYPNVDERETGISPWFRVALVDTYKRGVVLCLRIGGLKKCPGGYRFVDYVNGENSDRKAYLMGDVPYDSIEAVNMDGDEYYDYPHIYCYFDFDGQPYERLWFCEWIDQPHGHPYFKHIADYDEVVKNNPAEGTLFFG